jgi:uncharacterized protein (TIGR03086 family)
MDVLDLYRRAADEFGDRVHRVDDRWANPSACSEWDVRTLVNHLVNEQLWVVPLMAGATVQEVGDRFDGDLLGTDPVGTWDRAIAAATSSFTEPGALDRSVNVSFGQITAIDYAWQMTGDLTIHAWDLARGIGADEALDPDLCAAVLAALRPQLPAFTEAGLFAEPLAVPAGADAQTTLLALSGRQAGDGPSDLGAVTDA